MKNEEEGQVFAASMHFSLVKAPVFQLVNHFLDLLIGFSI
jgi:hypothetical protein